MYMYIYIAGLQELDSYQGYHKIIMVIRIIIGLLGLSDQSIYIYIYTYTKGNKREKHRSNLLVGLSGLLWLLGLYTSFRFRPW